MFEKDTQMSNQDQDKKNQPGQQGGGQKPDQQNQSK